MADNTVQSSYGRLPGVDNMEMKSANDVADDHFEIPKEPEPQVELEVKEEPPAPKPQRKKIYKDGMNEQEKKEALKAHLAEMRQKSVAVRKAKKEEKQANKKPRGRPKKEEEPVPAPRSRSPSPDPTPPEPPKAENKPVPTPPEAPSKKPEAYKSVNSSSTIDYEKLAEMVAGKLRPSQPVDIPKPTSTPTHNFSHTLGEYETYVRKQEREKMEQERKEREKADKLANANKQYFRGLPPQNFHKKENNSWANLFVGK